MPCSPKDLHEPLPGGCHEEEVIQSKGAFSQSETTESTGGPHPGKESSAAQGCSPKDSCSKNSGEEAHKEAGEKASREKAGKEGGQAAHGKEGSEEERHGKAARKAAPAPVAAPAKTTAGRTTVVVKKKIVVRRSFATTTTTRTWPASGLAPWQDAPLSAERRAADLVSRMTLDEKMKQLLNDAPAIPRLGVSRYVWQCEGLHGVARAGVATVFPQSIGLAATWNTPLLQEGGRRHLGGSARQAPRLPPQGGDRHLQGPHVLEPEHQHLPRPALGTGQETYGEDPYLTARLGVAFVTRNPGGRSPVPEAVATPKHFAVHSGPEAERHVRRPR